MIKMVVSDVDGTLIYKGQNLNKVRFPSMLNCLYDKRIPFIAATGRHYREMCMLFNEHANKFISICCDGAYAIFDNRLLYSLPIPNEAITHFFQNSYNLKSVMEFHSLNTTYIYGATPSMYLKELRRLSNLKKISEFSEIEDEIYMITIYGNNIPPSHESTRLCYSSNGIYEYINLDASKYNALRFIADSLEVSDSEILAFGDAENDREILTKCGNTYSTYCADKNIFNLTKKHTRDVIGTIISLINNNLS